MCGSAASTVECTSCHAGFCAPCKVRWDAFVVCAQKGHAFKHFSNSTLVGGVYKEIDHFGCDGPCSNQLSMGSVWHCSTCSGMTGTGCDYCEKCYNATMRERRIAVARECSHKKLSFFASGADVAMARGNAIAGVATCEKCHHNKAGEAIFA